MRVSCFFHFLINHQVYSAICLSPSLSHNTLYNLTEMNHSDYSVYGFITSNVAIKMTTASKACGKDSYPVSALSREVKITPKIVIASK